MNSGEYYNQRAADWARQNIKGRVEVKLRFSSRAGQIFIYALLFSVPGAFFAVGLVLLLMGAKAKDGVGAAFFFGFLLLIPCGLIVLLGAYVRRGFAKSLDSEGVNGARGYKFYWAKLYYVDHVSKYYRTGRVGHKVKDNQLELVFEGGKVIIPPLIHERAKIWALINSLPVEVRDDGVPRAVRVQADGESGRSAGDDLMVFLNLIDRQRNSRER